MSSLIIGEARDLHVLAVAQSMRSEPVVLDIERLRQAPFLLADARLNLAGAEVSPTGRGWIRRISPPGWMESTDTTDLQSAIRGSCLSVLGAVLRIPGMVWLSPIDVIGAADNKAVQYQLARRAGCQVPDWLITTNPEFAPQSGQWVAKPIGPAYFMDGDVARVLQVTEFHRDQASLLAGAPFLLQRFVRAIAHARVVTVRNRAFAARLPAHAGLPVDWRQDELAHGSFAPYLDDSLARMAVQVATACEVGYSSQDWIQDTEGSWWFVDLNAGGQWLFLPEPTRSEVTRAIAAWLDGEE